MTYHMKAVGETNSIISLSKAQINQVIFKQLQFWGNQVK